MRNVHKIAVAAMFVSGLIPLLAFSQNQGVSYYKNIREYVIFAGCAVLFLCWLWQIFMVQVKLKELDRADDQSTIGYSRSAPDWLSPHRWAFFLVVIFLPVGLSLCSRVLPLEETIFPPELAYHFAASIFIIMITLEIAAIFNLSNDEWRPLLTAALTIDLLAFVGFSMMGKPSSPDVANEVFMALFFLATGATSLVSSFLTLYHARTYQRYLRNETPRIPPTAPSELKSTEPEGQPADDS